jgi:hypothetical protein
MRRRWPGNPHSQDISMPAVFANSLAPSDWQQLNRGVGQNASDDEDGDVAVLGLGSL